MTTADLEALVRTALAEPDCDAHRIVRRLLRAYGGQTLPQLSESSPRQWYDQPDLAVDVPAQQPPTPPCTCGARHMNMTRDADYRDGYGQALWVRHTDGLVEAFSESGQLLWWHRRTPNSEHADWDEA